MNDVVSVIHQYIPLDTRGWEREGHDTFADILRALIACYERTGHRPTVLYVNREQAKNLRKRVNEFLIDHRQERAFGRGIVDLDDEGVSVVHGMKVVRNDTVPGAALSWMEPKTYLFTLSPHALVLDHEGGN